MWWCISFAMVLIAFLGMLFGYHIGRKVAFKEMDQILLEYKYEIAEKQRQEKLKELGG